MLARERAHMDASELKRELAKVKSGKNGRYPATLRDAVVEYAAKAKEHGKSHAKVAAELGMSEPTLSFWRAQARSRGNLVPVAIVAAPRVEREPIVEPGPLRVRGLDIAGVAELLKRLA
jgi:transposase-like protein